MRLRPPPPTTDLETQRWLRDLASRALGLPSVVKVAAAHTASDGELVEVDATAGPVTVTLPDAHLLWGVEVVKTDATANAVTVAAASGDTVNGGASVSIATQWGSKRVNSDGDGASVAR